MQESVAKDLVEAGQNEGLDMDLREDYSGRGMFGDRTAAVCADSLRDIILCFTLCAADSEPDSQCIEDLMDAARSLRWDQMGRGIVVY